MDRVRIPRWAWAAAIVAGLLAVAWLVGTALSGTSRVPFTTAKGVRVSVLGVTYGTQHRCPGFVSGLPRGLREVVRRLTGRSGPGPDVITTAAPELVVWVRHDATNAAALSGELRFALGDESGQFAGQAGTLSLHGTWPDSGTLGFNLLPRRAAELRLLVYEFDPAATASGRYRQIASVPLSNPAAGRHPQWVAQPFPVRQTNNGLTCSLNAVRTGVGISSTSIALPDGTTRIRYSRAADDAQNRALLEVAFEDLANPSNRWEVTSVVLADATGNVVTNGSLGSSSFGSEVRHFVFGPCLWPSEIWDLTLTAGRRAGSGFGAAESLTFTGVPLPAVGEVGRVDRVRRSGDTTVTLTSIQRRAPLADSEHWSGARLSQVELRVSGLPADHRFTLVRATDDLGRVLEVSQHSWGSAEPHEATFAFRNIARDARTLDLQFAVHRLVSFTFRVQPDLATTNDFTPGGL